MLGHIRVRSCEKMQGLRVKARRCAKCFATAAMCGLSGQKCSARCVYLCNTYWGPKRKVSNRVCGSVRLPLKYCERTVAFATSGLLKRIVMAAISIIDSREVRNSQENSREKFAKYVETPPK